MKKELIEQIAEERGVSPKTKKSYYSAVNSYEAFIGKKIEDLLMEAENEEEDGVRWKNRHLKTYLINYRSYLANNCTKNTTKSYLNCIKTIYKHQEIEIHELPSFRNKQGIEREISFGDLITKEELLQAYNYGNNLIKALVLFMSSSGVTRIDSTNITVAQFINACADYITTDTLKEQLSELQRQSDIVPTWYLKRQKTSKNFYTFNTPEATKEIINYLYTRNNLSYEDKLFQIHPLTINRKFKEINTALGFGSAGSYNKFVPHMLRKYQASVLTNCKNAFTEEEVDVIQGRSKDKIRNSYFKNDPSVLKEKYLKCVRDLSITGDEVFAVNEVKAENALLKNKIDEQDNKLNTVIANQKRLEVLLNR